MFALIRAEFVKIFGKKSTKVALVVIFIITAISCIFQASTEVNDTNWREKVQEELEIAESEIEDHKGTESEEFYVSLYQSDIEIAKYCLENNIAKDVMTPIKFAYENKFCMGVWVVVLVMIAAINFSDEFQFGTIKQILTRPYKRSKILLVKQIVFVLLSAASLLLQLGVSYLIGVIFFDKNSGSEVTVDFINGNIIEIKMITALWQTFFSYMIILLFLMAVVFLLVSVFRTCLMPIILSLLVWMGSNTVASVFSKYKIIKYTVFPHLDLTQYIKGNELVLEGNTMTYSLIIIVVSFLIVQSATYTIFSKRDI